MVLAYSQNSQSCITIMTTSFLNIFITFPSKKNTYPSGVTPPFLCPLATNFYLMDCPFRTFHINRTIQYVAFRVWLLSFNVFNIHPRCSMHHYFTPFDDWILFHCIDNSSKDFLKGKTNDVPPKKDLPISLGLLGQHNPLLNHPSLHLPSAPMNTIQTLSFGLEWFSKQTEAQDSFPESYRTWQKQLKFLLREFIMTLKMCSINLHGPGTGRQESRIQLHKLTRPRLV